MIKRGVVRFDYFKDSQDVLFTLLYLDLRHNVLYDDVRSFLTSTSSLFLQTYKIQGPTGFLSILAVAVVQIDHLYYLLLLCLLTPTFSFLLFRLEDGCSRSRTTVW